MGRRPNSKDQLDRIDNDGNYCKENCAWVTKVRNCRHTSKSVFLTVDGVTKHGKDWAEEMGIPYDAMRARMHIGWTVEEAIKIPYNPNYALGRKAKSMSVK